MKMKIYKAKGLLLCLAALCLISSVGSTFNFITSALEALACGCGCQFYDVGTCETRYTTECDVKYEQRCETIYKNKCNFETNKECQIVYRDDCTTKKQCSTQYRTQCENVPQKKCKNVEDQKCHKEPERVCHDVQVPVCEHIPEQQCSIVEEKQCEQVPKKVCSIEEVCETVYESKCKPDYKYRQVCESIPQQNCKKKENCGTEYEEKCQTIEKEVCNTIYTKKCTNITKKNCKVVYKEKCLGFPKQLCTTESKRVCKNVPEQKCKNVRDCRKVPEDKCWISPEVKCNKVPEQICKKIQKKNCWPVAIKKNRYVKKRLCQKCQTDRETIHTKKPRQSCKLVPKQDCKTIYVDECVPDPIQKCTTIFIQNCSVEKKCTIEYKEECTEKPAYKPSYASKDCKTVPVEKCWDEQKCINEPQKECKQVYQNKCSKVPKEKCSHRKELQCNKYLVDVPSVKTHSTCVWPRKKPDRFCKKISAKDILLAQDVEFQNEVEYIAEEVDDKVDFVEIFPPDYKGNPNDTLSSPEPTLPPPTINIPTSPPPHIQEILEEDVELNIDDLDGRIKPVGMIGHRNPAQQVKFKVRKKIKRPTNKLKFLEDIPVNKSTTAKDLFPTVANTDIVIEEVTAPPLTTTHLPPYYAPPPNNYALSPNNYAPPPTNYGGFVPDSLVNIFQSDDFLKFDGNQAELRQRRIQGTEYSRIPTPRYPSKGNYQTIQIDTTPVYSPSQSSRQQAFQARENLGYLTATQFPNSENFADNSYQINRQGYPEYRSQVESQQENKQREPYLSQYGPPYDQENSGFVRPLDNRRSEVEPTTTASQQPYGGESLQQPQQVNLQPQRFLIKGSRRNVDANYNDYHDSDTSHFDATNFEEHSLNDWSWGDKI